MLAKFNVKLLCFSLIISSILLLNSNTFASCPPPTFVEVTGSPFTTGLQPTGLAWSPNSNFVSISDQGSDTISVYSVNQTTGVFTPIAGSPFASPHLPQSTDYSPDGRFLAVGLASSTNAVAVFSVDQTTGALTPAAGSPFASPTTFNIFANYSPNGKFLATSDTSSSQVTIFIVNQLTGALSSPASFPSGGITPFESKFSPDNNFLAVALRDSNNIAVFSVDQTTGALTATPGSPFASSGLRPRRVDFSPDGKFVAVTNQGDGVTFSRSVSVYSINSTGVLTEISGSPFATGAGPSGIDYYPTGQLSTVANEAGSQDPLGPFPRTFGVYNVNLASGAFSPLNGTLATSVFSTGSQHPNTIKFSPNGKFVAVANSTISPGTAGNTVTVYLINSTPLANPITVSTTCNTPITIMVETCGLEATVTSVSSTTHGTAVISGTNEITYTPNNNFSGTDSFIYTVTDFPGNTSTAQITVNISGCFKLSPLAAAIRHKYCNL